MRDPTGEWKLFLVQMAVILAAVMVVRTFVVQPYVIPSASMIPTLQIGDYIATTKYSYGWSRYSMPFNLPAFKGRLDGSLPQRGDVVVFRYTQDPTVDYIKRAIGLPGDHVQMRAGRLFINGHAVATTAVGPYSVHDDQGRLLSGTVYTEDLPRGRGTLQHPVLKLTDGGAANNTADYVVPQGCVFFMGDDRDDSADSRFQGGRESGACPAPPGNDYLKSTGHDLGFVPMQNLVGRARLVLFSVDMHHPAWEFWYWPSEIRWGRFFQPIP
ncbi:signal peptidase I [Formicincola oecophyllae]|uniref:Signal peptidase I n=1 Tax=Formicincola oecophyllae TaxID=2558361 RepID=A0A4Y6UD77_9PROT|nr:signal peptidase I [Formicincola oecophyllae]